MATEVRKILGQVATLATTEATLYTVTPGLKEMVSSSLIVCNRAGTASTFRVAVVEDGSGATANEDYIYYDVTIAGADTFVAKLGLTLNGADEVRVYASTANLTFALFGLEITP